MLSVFICEDNMPQRRRLEGIIKTYLMIEEYNMDLTLSTDDPYAILNHLEANPKTRGIYFLDVDLKQDINGIELGAMIRKKDIDAKIIFITTHSEFLSLTFQYKVEAMDYILKEQPEKLRQRIHDCLQASHDYYTFEPKEEPHRIKLKINNQIRIFNLQDIMFFETTQTPHKVKLHLTNSTVELYGSLTEIETLSKGFKRVHKSFLVNQDTIAVINKKERLITFLNGETCFSSFRGFKLLN